MWCNVCLKTYALEEAGQTLTHTCPHVQGGRGEEKVSNLVGRMYNSTQNTIVIITFARAVCPNRERIINGGKGVRKESEEQEKEGERPHHSWHCE